MFEANKLTKNNDPERHSHSEYGIGFDLCLLFSYPKFDCGKNIMFGVENNSSVHTDNKKKIY